MAVEGMDAAPWRIWAQVVWDYVSVPVQLGSFGDRWHPSSFIALIAVGLVVFALKRHRRELTKNASPLSFLFPRAMYLTRSTLVDIKVYVAGVFVDFGLVGIKILSTSAVAATTAGAIIAIAGTPDVHALSGWRWVACLLAVGAAYDFGGYWLHRISHENPVLWPFHKVHHSATSLTPLTVARIHPMYPVFGSFFIPLPMGVVAGVIYAAFGEQNMLVITAINAVYHVFNLAGANLRHAHIWLSYGPVFSRIFVSPAMHQIHHSVEDRHWNKNYAEIFSLWDWLFGTLYVPKEREEFAYGCQVGTDGAVTQPHPTLRAALIDPYLESGRAIRDALSNRGSNQPAADPP